MRLTLLKDSCLHKNLNPGVREFKTITFTPCFSALTIPQTTNLKHYKKNNREENSMTPKRTVKNMKASYIPVSHGYETLGNMVSYFF